MFTHQIGGGGMVQCLPLSQLLCCTADYALGLWIDRLMDVQLATICIISILCYPSQARSVHKSNHTQRQTLNVTARMLPSIECISDSVQCLTCSFIVLYHRFYGHVWNYYYCYYCYADNLLCTIVLNNRSRDALRCLIVKNQKSKNQNCKSQKFNF